MKNTLDNNTLNMMIDALKRDSVLYFTIDGYRVDVNNWNNEKVWLYVDDSEKENPNETFTDIERRFYRPVENHFSMEWPDLNLLMPHLLKNNKSITWETTFKLQ